MGHVRCFEEIRWKFRKNVQDYSKEAGRQVTHSGEDALGRASLVVTQCRPYRRTELRIFGDNKMHVIQLFHCRKNVSALR